MSNKIEDLIEIIKNSPIPVSVIAKDLKIPAHRIYGWTTKGATPGHEDVEKLKEYFKTPEKSISKDVMMRAYDALFDVIIAEIAALKAEKTGEPVHSLMRKIREAAEYGISQAAAHKREEG